MDEQSRRSLHELITRAVGGDAHARTVIKELVLSLNRSGAAEDVSQALPCCMFSGRTDSMTPYGFVDNDYRIQQESPLIG
jgi:hypothetical protein